ncbi:hypothetical protein ABQF26_04650 [Mycolicibacterium elephantis]
MSTDTDITVPDRIDPTALIVAAGSPRAGTLRQSLGGYADQLVATGCFADLTERDTRTAAQVIAWEVVHGDQGDGLRVRARTVADGSWGGWDHPTTVAHVLATAATIITTW